MDIGKYIHELLLENDIVVVPGFGAFVSEYKPAEIDDDSDEIKPPSKVVTFNQQLRNNDGLLVGHVAETKRISHFDALKKIEKEREDILYKLDSGEEVELDEVGSLYTTKDNLIGFKALEDENLLLDAYGLEPTSIEPSTIDEPTEIIPPVEMEEQKEEENNTVEEEIQPPHITADEKTEDNEGEDTEPVDEKPTTIPRMAEPVEEKEEEKKKRGWLWLLLVLIPLIAVSVFVFLKGFKDGGADKQNNTITTEKEAVEPQIPAADSLKRDTITIQAQDSILASKTDSTEIKTEPAVPDVSEGPKYYLVGGSFSIEENADEYIVELKARGINAYRAGKKGRFYIVGIGSFDSFSEAEKAKQEYMGSNPGSEVWVWKK